MSNATYQQLAENIWEELQETNPGLTDSQIEEMIINRMADMQDELADQRMEDLIDMERHQYESTI